MAGWVAGAIAVSSIYGASQSKKAAGIQAGAADRATAAQTEQFERQVQLQEPWRLAGEEALGYLKQGIKPGGEFARDFSLADYQADPGYAFRLSEGMKSLDRTAASRGGLLSGSTLKGALRFGQDLASQDYTNAFNRYQVNRANRINPLLSVAGLGQTSTNALTTASGQFGQNVGANIIGAGNAAAAGTIGSANAMSSGLNQGINFYQGQQYLNRLPNFSSTPQYSGYTSSPSSWDAAALNAGPQPY